MKSIFMDVGRNFIHIGIDYGLVVKNFVKLARNSFAQGDNFIISENNFKDRNERKVFDTLGLGEDQQQKFEKRIFNKVPQTGMPVQLDPLGGLSIMWYCLITIFKESNMIKIVFLILCGFALSGCEKKPDPDHLKAVEKVLQNTAENMVFVKDGTFMMGDSGDGKEIEYFGATEEQYAVKNITLDSYSINKYETTWGELVTYLKDVDRYDQYNEQKYRYDQHYIAVDDISSPNYFRRAARAPSWYEAEGYCLWLAEKTGLPYALSTEAQWEYAARSRGERVRYATHDGMTLVLDDYLYQEYLTKDPDTQDRMYVKAYDPLALPKGNAYGITVNEFEWYTRIVGSYLPNKLGIHDMSGNVQEWVRDWYEKDHYKKMDKNNPQGPSEAKYWGPPISKNNTPTKVLRDWVTSGLIYGRSYAYVSISSIGFRCALNSPEPI